MVEYNTGYNKAVHNFEADYTNLNSEQREAVDTIDGPLLVLAGPGTGKTQLLSARVANILQKTDAQPQNILCLTFTDAAAHNMRERLMTMIGETAYDVHLNTYHSFASDIIKAYPDYFETIDLDTGQDSRMERPIDELRQLEIIEAIISSLPFSDPLRSARHYLKSVLGTVADFKQAALTPQDIRRLAQNNLKAVTALSPKINKLMSAHGRIPSKPAVALELFSAVAQVLKENTNELSQAAYKELEAAVTDAAALQKTKPLTTWKDAWLTKDENDQWSFTNPLHAAKLLSLAEVFQKYQDKLAETGQYDFNDMIIRTIDALKTKPDLKFTLQEKYQYILLDEFQDTNAAQFELVKQLADHPVHEGRPNIMAVGDDDQGIFAFQGADIGNMVSFIKNFRDVRVINLIKNYRSHQDILHVAHNIAEQIESRLHHHLENISKDIEAASTTLPKDATIARHEFAGQASEYGWIAEQIAKLIKSGVHGQDIAILAPKHAVLEGIVPFLNVRSIPVAYEKRENIFETPIVQSLLLMAQFLRAAATNDIPLMDTLLPRVLSLDFWGIPTKTLWGLNWNYYRQKFTDETPWSQLALEVDETKQAAEFMLYLGARADNMALEEILDYLTGAKEVALDDGTLYTCPMKTYYFSEGAQLASPLQFYEAISHLSVIRTHLRDQQVHNDAQLTITDLLRLYETYEEAEQPLINTHPIAQSNDAVQLQTVYKAKGLEYDYVFLPNLQDDVWGSTATSGSNKLSLPPNLQYVRHDASTEDTRRRILFVAITRARHGLYATSYAQKDNGKKTLPVKYMFESQSEDGRVSEVLPANVSEVIQTDRPAEQARQDVDTFWHARHLLISPSLKSLLSDRLQKYIMSPTHLNSFTNVEYSGPQAFLLNTLLRFPEAPTPQSTYGDALHKTLEWFQKQGFGGGWPTISAATSYFEQRIARTNLSDIDKTNYSEQGTRALKIYLQANGEKLKTPAKAEVDFRGEGVTLGDARLTGKIDRLEIDSKNKKLRVIDFKSGSPSTKWSSQTKYLSYKQQLYFYILLLEKSYTYREYQVESAALEFLEPLPSGEAAPPLVLPFDQNEYDEFKKLVEVVWSHIQDLDLPSTEPYPKTAVGMRAFINTLLKTK